MDLNADGYTDILSGSYSRLTDDMAGIFQVLYATRDATFEPARELQGTDAQPLIIPAPEGQIIERICTRPTAVDIDDDGHLDIITGTFAGTFYLFQGKGKGNFDPKATKLTTPSGDLHIAQHHSDPFFVDWDADGDLDILSGSADGGVFLITNTGTRKAPAFADPKELIKPVGRPDTPDTFGDAHITGPQSSTRVWAADVNADDKLDLLVGDTVQLLHLAEGVDESTARAKDAIWLGQFNEHMSNSPRDDDPEARQKWEEQYHKLNEERKEYVIPESTGFVWLYLRK